MSASEPAGSTAAEPVNLTDPEAVSTLMALASALNVDPQKHAGGLDHLGLLNECSRVLRRRVLPQLSSTDPAKAQHRPIQGQGLDLSQFPAGVETGNAAVDAAIAVLRMLYIADLREMQDVANDLIVTVQAHTANPKTDSSLGAVGR